MSYEIKPLSTGSGLYVNDGVGENVGKNKVVFRHAAEDWRLADADAAGTMPAVGLTLSAIASGTKGRILFQGFVVNKDAWAWTPGANLYISTVAGELTEVAPTGAGDISQNVAVAMDADTIYFDSGQLNAGSGIFPANVDIAGDLTVDVINEHTVATGVTVEGVLMDTNTVTVPSLTDTRVTFAGAGGLLTDDADMTFATDTLTVTKIVGDTHIQTDLIIEKTADAGVTIDGVLMKDGDILAEGQVFGVKWNQNTDTWTQIDIDGSTITPSVTDFNNHEVWGNITRVNLADSGIVNARFGDGDYASDGSNGEVMVEIPAFYVKGEQTTPKIYEWWISRVPLTGFEIHPAFLQRDGRPKAFIYVGAYEASLMVGTGVHDAVTTLKLHTRSAEQPWTGGELDALPYDSGSVEFTRGETITGATNGGTGVVVDWDLTGGTWGGANAAGTVYIKQHAAPDFIAENLNGSTGGANMAGATGVQVAEALDFSDVRDAGAAHGEGWGQMGLWSLSAVKLLFIIEYGNMDSQTEVGRGVVDLASGAGYAGLETAAAGVDGNLDTAGTGVGTGSDGDVPATYRFMENLWGNTWCFIDGYNAVDAEYRLIERSGLGTFEDGLATYEASSMAPLADDDGYISDIEWDRVMKYLFIASATSGSSSTYIPDYQYSHDTGETNILLAGGSWSFDSNAGLGGLNSNDVASFSFRALGARAEYLP